MPLEKLPIFTKKVSAWTLSKQRRKRQDAIAFKASSLRAMLKHRSKIFDIPFDEQKITVDFVEALFRKTKNCECCHCVLKYDNGIQRLTDSASIDRIIPEKGYVFGNIAVICWKCNNIKRNYSANELRIVADWIDSKT